eukprot:scaffold255_cov264-Prasinococcus_capsulatus_cf.AAC.4
MPGGVVLPRIPAGVLHDPGARGAGDALGGQLREAGRSDRLVGHRLPEPRQPAQRRGHLHRPARRLCVLPREGRGGREGGLGCEEGLGGRAAEGTAAWRPRTRPAHPHSRCLCEE